MLHGQAVRRLDSPKVRCGLMWCRAVWIELNPRSGGPSPSRKRCDQEGATKVSEMSPAGVRMLLRPDSDNEAVRVEVFAMQAVDASWCATMQRVSRIPNVTLVKQLANCRYCARLASPPCLSWRLCTKAQKTLFVHNLTRASALQVAAPNVGVKSAMMMVAIQPPRPARACWNRQKRLSTSEFRIIPPTHTPATNKYTQTLDWLYKRAMHSH